MENLNAEAIKDAVACRTGNIIGCMNDECAYFHKGCDRPLFVDILALIETYEEKIFALENRLKEFENGYRGTLEQYRYAVKADTVRKMQQRVRKKIKKTDWLNGRAVYLEIDQIAKEMLEDL